jgi:hypothetical protein
VRKVASIVDRSTSPTEAHRSTRELTSGSSPEAIRYASSAEMTYRPIEASRNSPNSGAVLPRPPLPDRDRVITTTVPNVHANRAMRATPSNARPARQ